MEFSAPLYIPCFTSNHYHEKYKCDLGRHWSKKRRKATLTTRKLELELVKLKKKNVGPPK